MSINRHAHAYFQRAFTQFQSFFPMILVASVAAFFVLTYAGDTRAETLPGKPICGGVENGKLQNACDRKPAKYISKARGECPRGSFFDLGTWTCYQCPSGYQRTANSVTEWDACSKDVPDQRVRAQYKGRTTCPSGSFIDPRNGGECWSCPSGYGRTLAAVNEWNACGAAFKDARSATFRGKACKDGFFDPRKGGECWSCPAGTLRTASAVDAGDACIREVDLKPAKKIAPLTCEAGDHFDLVDGGTCWRCPKDYVRTIFNVKGREACETSVVQWNMPDRRLPGLFGLPGAEEVAIDILQSREELTKLIKGSAEKLGKAPEKWAEAEWKLISDDPAKSSYLSTAILMKAVDAVGKPANQRTRAESQLIQAIETGIRENKIYFADQAKQIYDNWVRKRELEMGKQKGRMTSLTSWKGVPPDVNEIVSRGLTKSASTVAQTAIGVYAFAAIKNSTSFVKLVSPHAFGAAKEAAEIAANMLQAGKQIPAHIAKAANSATMGSAAAGPAIIVTVAMIVAQVNIEDMMEAERIRITTEDNLRKAQQPVNLAVFLQQEDGMAQLMSHWGIITSAPARPSSKFYAALNAPQLKIDADQKMTPQMMAMAYNGKPVEALQGALRKIRAVGTDLCLAVQVINPKMRMGMLFARPCSQGEAFTSKQANGKWKLVSRHGYVILNDGTAGGARAIGRGADIVPAKPPVKGKSATNSIQISVDVGRAGLQLVAQKGCLSVLGPDAPVVPIECKAPNATYWEVLFE